MFYFIFGFPCNFLFFLSVSRVASEFLNEDSNSSSIIISNKNIYGGRSIYRILQEAQPAVPEYCANYDQVS